MATSVPAIAYERPGNTRVYSLAGTGSIGASFEFEISDLPPMSTLLLLRMELVSGSGSTLNPKIGNATGWTVDEIEHIATNDTTAAFINDQTRLVLDSGSGSIYINPGVDSGSDNVVDIKAVIYLGVE